VPHRVLVVHAPRYKKAFQLHWRTDIYEGCGALDDAARTRCGQYFLGV
jgi:hypothetical protein